MSSYASPSTLFGLVRRDEAYRYCAVLLIVSIVFQKFTLPGSSGVLGFPLVALVAVTGWLAFRGALRVSPTALLLAAAFFACSAISVAVSSSARLSTASWWLLLAVQVPLIFTITDDDGRHEDILQLVSTLGAVFAVIGVGQLVIQAAIGAHLAFWLDFNIPSSIALKNYNNLNPLTWDSTIFKSNGFFFSEPSFFCQFLAICLLAELAAGARIMRLLLIGCGIVSTYSGTGLLTLAVFLPFFIPKEKRLEFLAAAAALVVLIALVGSYFQFGLIASRADEFNTLDSSGHMRFVAILELVQNALSRDLTTFLFGRGPGTVTEFFTSRPFETHSPTYAKVIYEYGTVGFAAYCAFFYHAVLSRTTRFAGPLAFTFVLLGGYLQDATIVAWILVLAGWRKPAV